MDVPERLGSCDIPPEQAKGRRSEKHRPERGALAHLRPHHLKLAHVREHLYREVPDRHAAVHLEVYELELGVYLHALDRRVRLERIHFKRRATCAGVVYDVKPTRRPVAPGGGVRDDKCDPLELLSNARKLGKESGQRCKRE